MKDNVIKMPDVKQRCDACGSTDIDEGGIKSMGVRVRESDDAEFEVLEFSDMTLTCHACGMTTRTVRKPTEKSILAFIDRMTQDEPDPVPVITAGDLVWQGRVAKNVSFTFHQTGAPLEQGFFFLKIVAVEPQLERMPDREEPSGLALVDTEGEEE